MYVKELCSFYYFLSVVVLIIFLTKSRLIHTVSLFVNDFCIRVLK